jgi:hypothetical protein
MFLKSQKTPFLPLPSLLFILPIIYNQLFLFVKVYFQNPNEKSHKNLFRQPRAMPPNLLAKWRSIG